MQINNIMQVDFKNPPMALKRRVENNAMKKSLEKTSSFKEFSFADYQKPCPSLIQSKDILELCDFFKERDVVVPEEIAKKAIEQYHLDAKEMAKIPEIANKFKESFEEDIKTANFDFLSNVRSIYKGGLITKEQLLTTKDLTPDGIEHFDKNNNVVFDSRIDSSLKPFVDECIVALRKQLPQYSITVYKDVNDNGEEEYQCIEIKKGDFYISFTSGQLIYSLLNKELAGEYKISMVNKDGTIYNYYPESSLIQKEDTLLNEIVGSIYTDLCNEKGEAVFEVDPDCLSGPCFYVKRLIDVGNRVIRIANQTSNFLDNTDEQTKRMLANLIENDEEVESLLLGCFPIEMFLCCIRNGSFNMNIAEAVSKILNTSKDWDDGYISYEYMNNLINLMDTEDHCIDDVLLEIASIYLTREHNSMENHHNTVYRAVSLAKTNMDNENIQNALIAIGASENVNFNEIDTLIDVLELKQNGMGKQARIRLKKLAYKNSKKWGGIQNAIKAYMFYTNL